MFAQCGGFPVVEAAAEGNQHHPARNGSGVGGFLDGLDLFAPHIGQNLRCCDAGGAWRFYFRLMVVFTLPIDAGSSNQRWVMVLVWV